MKKRYILKLFGVTTFSFLYSYIFICVMVWCFLGAPKGQLIEIILRIT